MAENRGQIYKITNNENGKIYIGMASNYAKDRWNSHCRNAFQDEYKTSLQKDIAKFGVSAFTFSILENGIEDRDELCALEAGYIKAYKEEGFELYNVKEVDTPKYTSEETKQVRREQRLGKKWSDEVREKMRKSHTRHPGVMKAIVVIELEKEFDSLKDVAEFLKVTSDAISKAVRLKYKCKGYTLKYKN